MKRPRNSVLILLAVLLFLVSFAVRARHPLSRPPQWYLRSLAFEDAIRDHDWEETFQRYHPGVTTMVLGATGQRTGNNLAYAVPGEPGQQSGVRSVAGPTPQPLRPALYSELLIFSIDEFCKVIFAPVLWSLKRTAPLLSSLTDFV